MGSGELGVGKNQLSLISVYKFIKYYLLYLSNITSCILNINTVLFELIFI